MPLLRPSDQQAAERPQRKAMAPIIGALKSLRRASKQNFRSSEGSGESSSEADTGSNGTAPTSGSITPPSMISSHSSDALNNLQGSLSDDGPYSSSSSRPPMPNRRILPEHGGGSPNNTNRYSMSNIVGISPSMPNMRGALAPFITNIEDKAWVHQKILAIRGEVGDTNRPIDGVVVVSHSNNQMPPIEFPVCASRFKALVSLVPGTNKLRFEFVGPRLAGGSGPHVTNMSVSYVPTLNAPPLQLAILVAKDSPRTFDSIPSRIDREGNGLETAVRKFRMAAYLWQAFTAEEMARHAREENARRNPMAPRQGSSLADRRSFRLEEEWTAGTSSGRDRDNGVMRSEARVHVVVMDKTVAEIRSLDVAQQNEKAADRGGLFPIAMDALKRHFNPPPGQKNYVAAMLLDSHWDPQAGVITGHAALGGGDGELSAALFGSHCLWSYPTCLEEVDACFTDCNPTDTKLVANDCHEAGSSWEACNIGIGAHLHEVGHALGLPHRPSGVMLRDYVLLHRSFVSREAFSTRTKEKGGPVSASSSAGFANNNSKADECRWHPLDYLHLRTHPCFKTTLDYVSQDPGVAAWPAGEKEVVLTAPSGLSHVEVYSGDSDEDCGWMVFDRDTFRATVTEKGLRLILSSSSSAAGAGPPSSPGKKQQQHHGGAAAAQQHQLSPNAASARLRVVVRSLAGGQLETADFAALASKEGSSLKVEKQTFWRSARLGLSNLPNTQASEVVLRSALESDKKKTPPKLLRRVVVYHGAYVNGIEFVYDDDETQLFGNRGGKPGGDGFEMNVWKGETVLGLKVKSGHWIDAVQVITSQNRSSPWYGGSSPAVHPTSLLPPAGFTFCGVVGTCGDWLDGISVVYRRGG